jgi:hypothetical protein
MLIEFFAMMATAPINKNESGNWPTATWAYCEMTNVNTQTNDAAINILIFLFISVK